MVVLCLFSGNWTTAEFLKRLQSVVATLQLCVFEAWQVYHPMRDLGEGRDTNCLSRPAFAHRLMSPPEAGRPDRGIPWPAFRHFGKCLPTQWVPRQDCRPPFRPRELLYHGLL